MAVIISANMSDKFKPDSSESSPNADGMKFSTNSNIIVGAPLLPPGKCKLQCDTSPAKPNTTVQLGAQSGVGIIPSTDEYCIIMIYKLVQATTTLTPIVVTDIGLSTTKKLVLFVTTGNALQVWYDGVQIGSDFVLTTGNVYRVGAYVNFATTTVKLYVDDVTSGTDITVATLRVSSSTVTMTNHPSVSAIFFTPSGTGGIHEFQHISVIDSSGTFNAPATYVTQPVCVTDASIPISPGTYFQLNFTSNSGVPFQYQDVDDIPPDDNTSFISSLVMASSSPTNASFDMSPWISVGSTTTDTILNVRATHRELDVSGMARQTLVHIGNTNTRSDSANGPGAWKYATWLLLETNPDSGLAWTIADYNNAEAGVTLTWLGADEISKITFIRMEAVFIRGTVTAPIRRGTGAFV